MDSSFFVKGLIIGFSIAAPVGPIGVLCIRSFYWLFIGMDNDFNTKVRSLSQIAGDRLY